jgi:hypothetical protein
MMRYLNTILLTAVLFISSTAAFAQLQVASGWARTYYNQPGSTGIPFDTNMTGHYECYGVGYSKEFIAKDFQMNVPDSAHIRGIQVSCDVIIHTLVDSSIYLLKYGIPYGTDGARRQVIVAAADIRWGDTSTLWGGTWGPMALNDTGFGIKLRLRDTGDGVTPISWIDANPIFINVFYDYAVPNAVANMVLPDIAMYPNPAISTVMFVTTTDQPYTISIMDMTGRKCLEKTCDKQQTSLNINQLSNGSYIAEIKYATGAVRKKLLVVEH